ncbi:hypothetical protein JCM11251_000961 [Rhodosporidiobolus azoricus]
MATKEKPGAALAAQPLFQARPPLPPLSASFSRHPDPSSNPQTSARRLAQLHTILSALAFASTLAVGLYLHHRKIVKNQWFGWPKEWFPSVSATIGDHFPERNLFQLLIALTSGPRFLLILLTYVSQLGSRKSNVLPAVLAVTSASRTLFCGGWVFVTSSDHGDVHDIFMVGYIVLNLPYMILTTYLTPSTTRASSAKSARRWLASAFFATLVPLVYWYIQHKVHRRAGAYSIYALFEWSLIVLDVSFDSISILDFSPSSGSLDSTPRTSSSSFPSDSGAFANLALSIAPSLPSTVEELLDEVKHDQEANKGLLAAIGRMAVKTELATSAVRGFAAEVYLSYVFWTLLVAIGPMIFYNSVWAMGLSGDELLLLCVLSPFLLLFPRFNPLLGLFSHPAVAHLGLLIGLCARWSEDTTGDGKRRLWITAGGLGAAVMGRVGEWWKVRADRTRLEGKAATFLSGLLLSLLLKFTNHSLNPLWPFVRSSSGEPGSSYGDPRYDNGGWNGVGLVIAVVAFVDLATRRTRPAAQQRRESGVKEEQKKGSFAASFASVVAFASLFFLLHFLYTDTGTIIHWTFSGYPHSGPSAFRGGIFTLVFLLAGLLTPSYIPASTLTSPPLYVGAAACATLLFALDGWAGFIPGALLGTYSIALFPPFLSSLLHFSPSSFGPGATFGSAMFLYALLELLSTVPVAYAFVPVTLGLRERTDVILALVMGGIGIGLLPLRLSSSTSTLLTPSPLRTRALKTRLSILALLSLTFALSIISYRQRGGGTWDWNGLKAVEGPYKPEERVFTAAIWTMHFGLDGRMWESGRRMAEFFREAELDVIGLLETDVHRVVGGNRDITQYVSHALKMPYVDLGPSPHKNTWGAALISKFPILRSTHHLLPSPSGELAPAIFATLNVYGTEVDVVVPHNGQEEDPVDRKLQSIELARLMSEGWPRPTVFIGYLVTKPHAERPSPYKYIFEDGKMLDVQPKDLDRWCQYIGYRGVHRVAYGRLQRGSTPSITDSELQLAKFVVPYPNATVSPYTEAALEIKKRAEGEQNADVQVPPVPVEDYVSHLLHSAAPVIASSSSLATASASHSGTVQDTTLWTPARYIPPSLQFPRVFDGKGTRGHYWIVLTEQSGAHGPNYFMGDEEKEARRKRELEELAKQAGDGECGVQ